METKELRQLNAHGDAERDGNLIAERVSCQEERNKEGKNGEQRREKVKAGQEKGGRDVRPDEGSWPRHRRRDLRDQSSAVPSREVESETDVTRPSELSWNFSPFLY